MSKERERMAFSWQKSVNSYMLLITLIIGLFSALSVVPQQFRITYYWIMAIAITLFGLSAISVNADELVYYWKGLRDRRFKVSGFRKFVTLIVYIFNAIMGVAVIALGGYLMLILSGFIRNPFV